MKLRQEKIAKNLTSSLSDPSVKVGIQFPQLPDASPDPMLITDTKGNIYYVNPAWEKLTGYAFDEVKGKNPKLLNSGKTPKKIYKKLWEALSKGKSISKEEIIDKRKDGTEYQIHSTFFPIRKNNKNLFYVQALYDITKQKVLERQKDSFIGIASHELKTPITTLSAYTQILEKRLQNDPQNVYFLNNIKVQTNRLVNLIDDLLNVSRIDSGKLELHVKEFDLNTLINKIIVDFQYTTDTHEIVKDGDVQLNVICDENRIEQVLVNLLTNAIKYSPTANKVIIHPFLSKRHAIVAVQDFGLGITKKDQPHIFERFYRTQDKEEGKVSGFGLGLYIANEIIKKHKGKIWVESEKGKGSTFFMSLPVHSKKAEINEK